MSSLSPGVREDILIEAVRAIKSQRQRPSLERICRWLRFHKQVRRFDASLIAASLETATAKGCLQKTIKDGRETYCEWKKTPRERKTNGKLSMASAICQCIQQFGASEGLTLDGICEQVVKLSAFQNLDRLVLKYHIRLNCLKAVKRGKLLKEGRFYKLVRSGQLRWNMEDKRSDVDLSFLVDRAVTSKRPATPIEVCSFCLGTEEKNRNGRPEELLFCVDCGRSGHPSCLKFSSSLTEKVKKMRWQCIECKRCSVCADSSRGHSMLFCDSCDRGYHMDCCHPPIKKRPRGIWICCICDYKLNRRNSFLHRNNNFHRSANGRRRQRLNGTNGKCGSNKLLMMKRRNSLTSGSADNGSFESISDDDDDSVPSALSFPVSKDDEEWYRMAQVKVLEKLSQDQPSSCGVVCTENRKPSPPWIEFGKYEVMTWYSSPYPDGYAKLSKLYICEFCLRYMESRTTLERHLTKCLLLRPPGDEIYRDGNLSVFEVDGNVAQVYCQNLCLLAKLFLDHKTLYYDVEPFLFYILTLNDSEGCHLVGYFSKEKYCVQKYNLSCIMILPQYQRHGYGRLLIDFSYILTREEGRTGTPEKPLSDLGQLTYQSYWKDVITAYLEKHTNQTVTIKDIGIETGICEHDVVATLQSLNLLVAVDRNRFAIVVDNSSTATKKSEECQEWQKKGRRNLDPSLLQWKPFVSLSTIQLDDSEAFQERKQLPRCPDKARDEKKQTEVLSRRGSLFSPRAKKKQTPLSKSTSDPSETILPASSTLSKTADVGDLVPPICSTPLNSDRGDLVRTRRHGLIDLSPVPNYLRWAGGQRDGMKTNSDDKSVYKFNSVTCNDLKNSQECRRRKKRGWVKGRKRGPRFKDLTSESGDKLTESVASTVERSVDSSSATDVNDGSGRCDCHDTVASVSERDAVTGLSVDAAKMEDEEITEIYECTRNEVKDSAKKKKVPTATLR